MKITFVVPLPRFSSTPVGGLAVVYEYANRLVARRHEVTIVHARKLNKKSHNPFIRLYSQLMVKARQQSNSVNVSKVPWYPVDSRVELLQVPVATASNVPDGDVLFGSLLEGEDYPEEKGMRFRFFQSYAVGSWKQVQEDAFWREPIPKIVIARWLYEQGLNLGVPADEMIHIPNGIDHSKYRITRLIENRPLRVAMLYHTSPMKGAEDGIKALELAKREFTILQAVLFGKFPRPKTLPDWIEYHHDPPQEELVGSIYNGSSIYLCPSWREGWHLPPAEAMACGCAVVSTDIGGVQDYAEQGFTALLSPPKDPEALAANLLRLIEDDELRIRLAKAGHERVQEFTWERSTELLEQFLTDKIGQRGI